MNNSSPDLFAPRQYSQDADSYEELFALNIELKEEYANLQNTHEFLQ